MGRTRDARDAPACSPDPRSGELTRTKVLVDKLIVGVLHLPGGGLQLRAAFATSRRHGPLKTLQARQLESALGRRGTVVFFVVAGLVLAAGAWLGSVGLASMP